MLLRYEKVWGSCNTKITVLNVVKITHMELLNKIDIDDNYKNKKLST